MRRPLAPPTIAAVLLILAFLFPAARAAAQAVVATPRGPASGPLSELSVALEGLSESGDPVVLLVERQGELLYLAAELE